MNEFNKYVGQIFTPEWVVKHIFDTIKYDGNLDKKILEPAAGVGNFVLVIIKRMIMWGRDNNLDDKEILKKINKNLYAVEIDSDNFVNLKKNVQRIIKDELDIEIETLENVKSRDSLRIEWDVKFDYIITNPPFTPTRYLPKKTREFIERSFKFKSDIYQAFYEKHLNDLKENGLLAYISPSVMKEDEDFMKYLNPYIAWNYEDNIFTAEIETTLFVIRR